MIDESKSVMVKAVVIIRHINITQIENSQENERNIHSKSNAGGQPPFLFLISGL